MSRCRAVDCKLNPGPLRPFRLAFLLGLGGFLLAMVTVAGAQSRVLGLDISAWQGNISQTTWNNLRTNENRVFVLLRSSRGGTTGVYNQNDPNNTIYGTNTLSQRYDDPYFVQNINRATAAGIYAGAYHFSRPDIVETNLNSGGIRNSGTNEADHFIEMAGAWMRPGYLMPVHDFEAGDGIRTDNEMAQFCIDFSQRIYDRMGIRPVIYLNGNYAAFVVGGASSALRNQLAQPPSVLPAMTSPANLKLWSARWPNQADPNAIDVQNGEPKDSYAQIYGPWDDYGTEHPWTFWQYASTGRLQSFASGTVNLDFDVARGGVEFLKDQLVPALWTHDGSGAWSTLTNWNSGLPPVAPVYGPGQAAPVGTQTLPAARLPGGSGGGGSGGAGVTSGQHDTVILDRPNANITVTLATGTYNIRKLYVRETLSITGGALTVNYAPSPDSTTNGAQFSAPVTLSGGSLSGHTLQVDAAQTFTLGGGALTVNTLNLMPHSSTPAKLSLNGNPIINSLSNVTAIIRNGSGAGSSGFVDLSNATRTITVGDGLAPVDLSVDVSVVNGGLTKAGPGTLRLTAANSYAGGTAITAGKLLVNNAGGSGTGSGGVVVGPGGILGGAGIIAGIVTVSSGGIVSPGTSIGALTLNAPPVLGGTVEMEIDRNGGVPLADQMVLTAGTLGYDGTLVVTNVGGVLLGGETFNLFSAPAYSGAFTNANLPVLAAGLNWDLGGLAANGTIKVNRAPVAGTVTFTNDAPAVVPIPIAVLLASATDADGDPVHLAGVSLTSTNGITLVTNGGFILYSNYVSVADEFAYTVEDGHGGSVVGTVQIQPNRAGRFAAPPAPAGDFLTLQFVGSPGWVYFLERSTNLLSWSTIWTNPAPVSGWFQYTDTFGDLMGPSPRAFYRLRWSP